jgi:hypothetical protein
MTSQIEAISTALKTIVKRRRKVLQALREQDRFGWEKWLQVELAYELASFGKPEFEVAHTYNHTRLKPKNKKDNDQAFIDLRFRRANHLKEKFTAIEIKVNETEKGFGPLLSDFIKIDALKDWQFRSVVAILAHGNLKESNTKFTRLREELLEKKFAQEPIHAKKAGVGFEFIVVGWERGLTKNMTHQSYSDWLQNLLTLCKKHDVQKMTARKRDQV